MRRTVIAVAAALVIVGSAGAARKPSAAEQKAIRQTFTGFVNMPNSPSAKDNRIVSLSVATLDPRYAAARLTSKSAGESDLVFHRGSFGWRVVGFGSSLGCDTAPKAVLDDLKIGCTPPNGVAWVDNCGTLTSKPGELVLACGDGNYLLTKLHWRGWGTGTTTATGVAEANTCTPNCAAGTFRSYLVAVSATKLTPCGKAKYYARLTITYPGARPEGVAKRDTHSLGC